MGWSYRTKRKKSSGFRTSISAKGLNVSYTINLGIAKVNVPLIGKRKKTRITAAGGGLFSKFF